MDIKSPVMALWWAIWNAGNEAIFRRKTIDPFQITKNVMSFQAMVTPMEKKNCQYYH